MTAHFRAGTIYTEAPSDSDVASFVDTSDSSTGAVTPIAIGFKSPTGLLFTTGDSEVARDNWAVSAGCGLRANRLMKNGWIELFEASVSAENALAGRSSERAVAWMEPDGAW